jgi:RNA polymerase sigma factor (TIGR02999 family)
MSSPREVTRLLLEWRDGAESALERLTPLVYDELHRLAERYLRRERPDHTLQPTALINGTYLRLIGHGTSDWQNRTHFFGVAANLIRRILVDYARAHRAEKRGGGEEEELPSTKRSKFPANAQRMWWRWMMRCKGWPKLINANAGSSSCVTSAD